MRYHVKGISRSTGREATLLIDAKHHEAAEAIAQRQLVVSEVVPEGGLPEPEIFDPRALDAPTPQRFTPAPPPPTRSRRPLIWILIPAILLALLVVLLIKRRF